VCSSLFWELESDKGHVLDERRHKGHRLLERETPQSILDFVAFHPRPE
jgi:hypothetical protein